MANNSVVTQQKLQEFYDKKIYDYLNGATHTGCDPVGTIKIVSGNEVPPYCLACDGTVYNIADYSDLAQFYERSQGASNFYGGDGITTFAVPDLRGEFLRGTGQNSHTHQGSGANVGVHQNATESMGLDEWGTYVLTELKDPYRTDGNNNVTKNMDTVIADGDVRRYLELPAGSFKTQSDATNKARYTSRPTNTSVLFCVVYKNNYIDLALDSFPIDISNPTDGQLLMYDATAGRWVNGGHKYSTDEHVVGTWIDGRNVYEKTIIGSDNNYVDDSGTGVRRYFTVDLLVDSSIDKLICSNGSFSTNASGWSYLEYSIESSSINSADDTNFFGAVRFNKDTKSIQFQCMMSKGLNATQVDYCVTVRYTKTTDTV